MTGDLTKLTDSEDDETLHLDPHSKGESAHLGLMYALLFVPSTGAMGASPGMLRKIK